MSGEQKVISQFEKNSVEMVKISLQKWRGNEYIDIRVWRTDNSGKNGKERPTHKGVTLNIELLENLIQGLEEVRERLEIEAEPPQEAILDHKEG